MAIKPREPTAPDEVGRKVFKRRRGEAIAIAIAAGLEVKVHVLEIDHGQVQLLCVAPHDVRLRAVNRQEGRRREKRKRAG